MVRTIKFNNGKVIPAVGWGNGTGGMQKSEAAVTGGVAALKAGILHIDTAQGYKTEPETGEAIKAAGLSRDQVWVTTKLSGQQDASYDALKTSVEGSIGRLGSIPDLILIHSPNVPKGGKIAEMWQSLERLVEDGTLKGCSLGFSNFRPQDIEAVMGVAKIKPVCNQLEYHPYVLTHLQPVLDLHEQYGIVVQSFGPLTPVLRHKTGGPLKPILERIAQRLSKDSGREVDAAGVLLLWTVQMGAVAVTTSGNPKNIEKMAGIEQVPELSGEELKEIEEVGRKVHFRGYPEHMNKDYPNPDLPEDL